MIENESWTFHLDKEARFVLIKLMAFLYFSPRKFHCISTCFDASPLKKDKEAHLF